MICLWSRIAMQPLWYGFWITSLWIGLRRLDALRCHQCSWETVEGTCNNQTEVRCPDGDACAMKVKKKQSEDGYIYKKGCLGEPCDKPDKTRCRQTQLCHVCCDHGDLCNADAAGLRRFVDLCWDNPCENKGTCSPVSDTEYRCVCPAGYTGTHCETPLVLQCYQCHEKKSDAQCNRRHAVTCQPGETCKLKVKKTSDGVLYDKGCLPRPCNKPGEIICAEDKSNCKVCCDNGNLCNEDSSHVKSYIVNCYDNPCQNGGTCTPVGDDGFTCLCTSDFHGPTCIGRTGAPTPWYVGGDCGVSMYPDAGDMDTLDQRIVGGIEPRPNEFPWLASLMRRSGSSNFHFCGSAILNRHWVLTAAHCAVAFTYTDRFVLVGHHSQTGTDPTEALYPIADVQTHPDYDAVTMDNDIALIRVTGPIVFGPEVAPICAANTNETYVHRRVLVCGWGRTVFGGSTSDVLLYVAVNTTTQAHCAGRYAELNLAITDNMICTTDNRGDTTRDACQGDSGGPLFTPGPDGVFRAVGVVSWGYGCASGYPGVFTKLQNYVQWIRDIIPETDRQ